MRSGRQAGPATLASVRPAAHTVLHTDACCLLPPATRRYNLSLGIGLADVKGKVFRIGHLGNMDELMLSSALCGAEMALIDAGVPITPGSGVARAIEYWQKTSRVIPTREGLVS